MLRILHLFQLRTFLSPLPPTLITEKEEGESINAPTVVVIRFVLI